MKRLVFISFILSIFIVGCTGHLKYYSPNDIIPQKNSVEINKNKDEVWKIIVPTLGKNFFVINNLNKESGIINISYNGDPEKYVNCGYIESYVMNARGKRTYNFPAAAAHQTYEIMDMKRGELFFVNRRMSLDGRMNLIIEEIGPNKTLVTISTRYILTKSITVSDVQHHSSSFSDTISFNTNQSNRFPTSGSHPGTFCQANGNLEKEVLLLLFNEK